MRNDELIQEMISTVKPLLKGKAPDRTLRLMKLMHVCFKNIFVAQIFIYFIENGAATSGILQVQLGLSEQKIFRYIKLLRSVNIIEPIIKVPQKKGSKGGPMPNIWGLVDNYTRQNIADTINLHYRCKSPKYRLAEELAQTMLDEAHRNHQKKIRYTTIISQIRGSHMPWNVADIIQLTAQYLHERGLIILYT